MFWYLININGGGFEPDTDPDDFRFTDDRGGARLALLIGLRVRVVAKPI